MCGIFGYFDRKRTSLSGEVVRAMGQSIRHRGPDDAGVHLGEGVALGNQRLSIIDIAGGHQPFYSDDGRIVVVQNGEIFNHVELAAELRGQGVACRTHSDTEVILRLYERYGIDFIGRLNGMFAIAIYDARIDELFLIRDRVGVKPLYLHDDGQRITFASEIKAILAAGVPARIDLEGINNFLTYNYVPLPGTAFAGIRHLLPGHYLRIGRNVLEEREWWSLLDVQIGPERAEAEWSEEFLAILDDAVRIRLRADVPFGAFLSGGVDSSTIVGLMARHVPEGFQTFCIGFHEQAYDESSFAEIAAQRFGTRHVMERVDANMLDRWPQVIRHCDQPHGDASFMPTLRVAELAARHVKVVLTGDGGDELFAGYDKYRDFFGRPENLSCSDGDFRAAYGRNISMFSPHAKRELYAPVMSRLLDANPLACLEALYDRASHQDRINQALLVDMQQLLPGNNLVKPDRMGMAVSLEARTPFLDYRMMEFAFRMPGSLKLRDGETKYLFKKTVAPLIGEGLAYRRKQMFTVPVGEWFRGALFGYCQELLTSEHSRSALLFNRHHVQSMLERHRGGSDNFTREIRALLAIELWMREFSVDVA